MMGKWARHYVGKPYRGNGPGGLHCWQLVRAIYSEQAGIDLPPYDDVDPRDYAAVSSSADEVRSDRTQFLPVLPGQEREFDLVFMNAWIMGRDGSMKRGLGHVGVVSSPGRVVHAELSHDVVEVPVKHPSIRGRIVGFYRHVRLL